MNKHSYLLAKAIDELNRITGLSFDLNSQDAISEEAATYASEQIQSLILAYKEKNDQTSIYKHWLTGEMDTQELLHTAKRFHIDPKASRVLFLIEASKEIDSSVFSILTNSFPDSKNHWFIPINLHQIAFIATYPKKITTEQIVEQAYIMMDILNAEAMLRVKIAYSSVTDHLNKLADAYKETSLALEICETFYPEKNIYAYNHLGIGRLIYGISKEQCISYMTEVIGNNYTEALNAENTYTFNCFFDNNLNIAETARQLHMHRNTLIYRLEQIQKQTELDIRLFHDAMTFKTALLVKNYLNTLI